MKFDALPKIEAAWLQEARRRYEQLESGKVRAIPAKIVIKRARTRLKDGHCGFSAWRASSLR